jgi:hypothetical protein
MGLLRLFGVKAKAPALPTANDATMQFMPAMGNTLAKSPILDEGTSGKMSWSGHPESSATIRVNRSIGRCHSS